MVVTGHGYFVYMTQGRNVSPNRAAGPLIPFVAIPPAGAKPERATNAQQAYPTKMGQPNAVGRPYQTFPHEYDDISQWWRSPLLRLGFETIPLLTVGETNGCRLFPGNPILKKGNPHAKTTPTQTKGNFLNYTWSYKRNSPSNNAGLKRHSRT